MVPQKSLTFYVKGVWRGACVPGWGMPKLSNNLEPDGHLFVSMVGYQLDDDFNMLHEKCVFFHQFHSLKTNCLILFGVPGIGK